MAASTCILTTEESPGHRPVARAARLLALLPAVVLAALLVVAAHHGLQPAGFHQATPYAGIVAAALPVAPKQAAPAPAGVTTAQAIGHGGSPQSVLVVRFTDEALAVQAFMDGLEVLRQQLLQLPAQPVLVIAVVGSDKGAILHNIDLASAERAAVGLPGFDVTDLTSTAP